MCVCAEQNLKALPHTIHEHIHADVHPAYIGLWKRRKKEDECWQKPHSSWTRRQRVASFRPQASRQSVHQTPSTGLRHPLEEGAEKRCSECVHTCVRAAVWTGWRKTAGCFPPCSWVKWVKRDCRMFSAVQLGEVGQERLQDVFRPAAGWSGSRETAGCFRPCSWVKWVQRECRMFSAVQLGEVGPERLQDVFRRAAGWSGSRETAGCFRPCSWVKWVQRECRNFSAVQLGEVGPERLQDVLGRAAGWSGSRESAGIFPPCSWVKWVQRDCRMF